MYDTSFSDFQDVDTGSFKNRDISGKTKQNKTHFQP